MTVAERYPTSTGATSPRQDFADEVVDEMLPETDWKRLVRTYPVAAMLVAFAGGAYLGYRRGKTLATAIGGLAAREVTRRVDQFLGG